MNVDYKIKKLNLRTRPKKSEVSHLKCDNSKLKNLLTGKIK